MQLDYQLPPGLGGLDSLDGLGELTGLGAADLPAASDLLDSLQLDAFSLPVSSTGAGGQPVGSGSGSGSDSPVVLPLVGVQPVPPAAAPFLPAAAAGVAPQAGQRLRSSLGGGNGASPATSESEARQRGRSHSPGATGADDSHAPAGAGGSGSGGAAGRYSSEEEKRLVSLLQGHYLLWLRYSLLAARC